MVCLLCITALPSLFANTLHQTSAVPQRVVVLNWDILENVLALGIVPVGAANVSGYRQWVKKPIAPHSIEDIGTRSEPNLEKIAQLKPDVILAASPQQDLISILEQIAPVIYMPNFSKNQNAAPVAIEHFQTLAKLFDVEPLAQQQLNALNQKLLELKQTLANKYPTPPKVQVIRFASPTSVFLYTENASTTYIVKKLGLNPPINVAPHQWGIKQVRINRLNEIDNGYVLYMLPFPDVKKLEESALWNAFSFVKRHQVNSVSAVWNYGGVKSLEYMAQAITDSLIELAPH